METNSLQQSGRVDGRRNPRRRPGIVANPPRLRVTPLTETAAATSQIVTYARATGSSSGTGTDMHNSTAAAVSTETPSHPKPHRMRRGQLIHIDPLASERADSAEEPADDLAAARGILLGVAAGVSFWIMLAFGIRAMWGWLAA